MKKQYGELFVKVTKTPGTSDTITTVEAGLNQISVINQKLIQIKH